MRSVRVLGLAMLAASALFSGASAQSYPNALIGGEVQRVVAATNFGASCYVERGFSTWQRNGSGPKAVISFDEISYPVGGSSRDLRGQAVMTFSDASNGSIRFKITAAYPNGTVSVPFTGYSESFSGPGGLLIVKFNINFTGCTLPITATFDPT